MGSKCYYCDADGLGVEADQFTAPEVYNRYDTVAMAILPLSKARQSADNTIGLSCTTPISKIASASDDFPLMTWSNPTVITRPSRRRAASVDLPSCWAIHTVRKWSIPMRRLVLAIECVPATKYEDVRQYVSSVSSFKDSG